ncbi:hypothetical protein CYMTET_19218 [Cymbomonas tetramitiformis]|uniref:Uncharacterized protein n=1 Tax=Cymbomonas tetramitiformis TaxID=36881 RepID=A0AAE0G6N7_9CHLO|nr:hypothetical protein CYMTET_19218 [Cymbomonas tetramitiformis]
MAEALRRSAAGWRGTCPSTHIQRGWARCHCSDEGEVVGVPVTRVAGEPSGAGEECPRVQWMAGTTAPRSSGQLPLHGLKHCRLRGRLGVAAISPLLGRAREAAAIAEIREAAFLQGGGVLQHLLHRPVRGLLDGAALGTQHAGQGGDGVHRRSRPLEGEVVEISYVCVRHATQLHPTYIANEEISGWTCGRRWGLTRVIGARGVLAGDCPS